jgi:hypothetical protein
MSEAASAASHNGNEHAKPAEHDCAVCLEACVDKVTLCCFHFFCGACLEQWRQVHNCCPLCRKPNPQATSSAWAESTRVTEEGVEVTVIILFDESDNHVACMKKREDGTWYPVIKID